MPKPIFDINEYELRGITPPVFSEAQKKRLNSVLSRANGQMDWTAQLLGFNGPNYWGLPNPKADGSYDWKGLPDTMNQKRQLQATTFGVYDKDKEYSTRPAPFNRSKILASGDASFHIWESNGETKLSPAGQGELITYGFPDVFVGGEYIFDAQVEFIVQGDEDDTLRWSIFNGADKECTRMLLKQNSGLIAVKIKDSKALPCFIQPRQWQDISDWKSTEVIRQFIGIWGNKGNNLSFDAAFDAVELHGFSEKESLSFRDNTSCLTLTELLSRAGLKTTTWTKYWNTKFGFQVGGSPIAYPLPADDVEYIDNSFTFYTNEDCNYKIEISQSPTIVIDPENRSFDNKQYDESLPKAICLLNNGFYTDVAVPTDCEDANEGEYDRLLESPVPCTGNDSTVEGIKDVCFTYTAKSECAYIDFPCIEFVFDPSLNDGTYPKPAACPAEPGPWMTADDGEYDGDIATCSEYVGQTNVRCDDIIFCSFDDGEYDLSVEPNCNLPDLPLECEEISGGYYTLDGPPDYDLCDCSVGCCLIDNWIYYYDQLPYLGPEKANGGLYEFIPPVLYDNFTYDRDPALAICTLDNGTLVSPPSSLIANEGEYDRYLYNGELCVDTGPATPVEPCPPVPVRVNLKEIFDDLGYKMNPEVGNALTPLRVWKDRPLVVVDEVPTSGAERYNFLTADTNKGPDPLDSYRHFVRLPIEYSRNGPQWNKAEAVCNNQSYFSAPPRVSQTKIDPDVIRPALFDETYFDPSLPKYTLFYSESYLVSTARLDEVDNSQEGFSDAAVTFEPVEDIPFEYASVTEYDAFEERVPYLNGDWRGEYYAFGTNENLLSSFIDRNIANLRLTALPSDEAPVYDMSRIKLPNIEFPNEPDQATLKNYVVSYAYFVADYSASDDPVFDPGNEICWRSETLACEKLDTAGACISNPLPSHTAYLLHPTT